MFIARKITAGLKYYIVSVYYLSFGFFRKRYFQRKNSIVFVSTNGVGLGHLTRALGIARSVKKLNHEAGIIFFTTSPAINIVRDFGFKAYYLPNEREFPSGFLPSMWSRLFRNQLQEIFAIHHPKAFVFDGFKPYNGLCQAISGEKGMVSYWVIRRQRDIQAADELSYRESYFDEVLEPEELSWGPRCNNEENVAPVMLLSREEALSREQARKLLRIPENKIAVYIQLGAGAVNDIQSPILTALEILKDNEDCFLIVGESLLGQRMDYSLDSGFVLRDFPNSRYFNGFDLAISAAGYNTFHELLHFGVPTIFIPNENTGADDQVARAKRAFRAKAALLVRESIPSKDKHEAFSRAIREGLKRKTELKQNAMKLVPKNGSVAMAARIVSSL
jgi:UDP:flavonoid glycosyltransferase YjiC (YdhE family)